MSATAIQYSKEVQQFFDRKHKLFINGEWVEASTGKTIEVRINPDPVRNIYEGIKIPNGVITIESTDGGRSIIPVSGMLGCNLEN